MSPMPESGTRTTPGLPMDTEPVPRCPACDSPGASELFWGQDRLHGVPGSHRYVRCGECRAVYQSPRIVDGELHRAYTGEYYTHEPPAPLPDGTSFLPPTGESKQPPLTLSRQIRSGIVRRVAPAMSSGPSNTPLDGGRLTGVERVSGAVFARSRVLRERAFGDQVMDEFLPWRNPPGRALDVGCGSGRLLGRLARVGWEVEGVEWDPEAARVARSSGFPVHVGGAGTLPASLGPYHLMVMVHVLEHLPRPVEGLANLRELLAPGGRIVVVYPNPESLLRRRFGVDWFPWEVPRHLNLLPIPALRKAGHRAGLELRQVRTLARWADSTAWKSRALREGKHPEPPQAGVRERLWKGVEAVLVRAGASLGEEIVGVFTAR